MKRIYLVVFSLVMGSTAVAQSAVPRAYVGIGAGFDYGGLGGKVEFLPQKHIGIFGGVGYNLLSLGWNVGASYKIIPDNTVSPDLMVMYGYNGVFRGSDRYTAQYNMISYGITAGIGLDVLTGASGNKLSVGLLVPFRSHQFTENYHNVKDDPNVELKNNLLPVGVSFGYNILL